MKGLNYNDISYKNKELNEYFDQYGINIIFEENDCEYNRFFKTKNDLNVHDKIIHKK